MIYMWFIGINYYKLAVQKDRDFIFTTITTIWKTGSSVDVLIILAAISPNTAEKRLRMRQPYL